MRWMIFFIFVIGCYGSGCYEDCGKPFVSCDSNNGSITVMCSILHTLYYCYNDECLDPKNLTSINESKYFIDPLVIVCYNIGCNWCPKNNTIVSTRQTEIILTESSINDVSYIFIIINSILFVIIICVFIFIIFVVRKKQSFKKLIES